MEDRNHRPKGPCTRGPERNFMRDYIIMTDSCCDLSRQEIDELDLTVLPLSYTIDGSTYLNTPDHADMSPEDSFARIAAGSDCTTSAVNVGQFDEAMRRVLDAGRDILCICFSSALSTTYQSACIAADELRGEYPDAQIIVIDSLSASRGQGMLLYRTVQERRRTGADIETLSEYVRSIIQSQCHWFFVDDLNHLKRGGRVSATAAFVGTVLGIKPVLHADSEGRLIPMSKARGTKAALKALVDKVEELGVEPDKNQPMFICHAACPDSVAYVKELLRERFGVTDVRDGYIGPVVGAHTGCGTLGLFFVATQR